MVTVQQIYDMAIHLMDEQNESTGATQTVDTEEYKFRTLSILNTAIAALAPYSAASAWDSGRPQVKLLETGNYKNPDFTQGIPLEDGLSTALLPYFLAAQLLSGENEALAAWFMNRYREVFQDIRSKTRGEFEAIPMPYGGF